MKNKVLALLLCLGMTVSLTTCGGDAGSDESAAGGQDSSEAAGEAGEEAAESAGSDDFAGEELSIIVSADWMNDYYDETISRFEDTYSVTVDLQTIPADQYSIFCSPNWRRGHVPTYSGFSPIRSRSLL